MWPLIWPPRWSLRVLRCPPSGLLRLRAGDAGCAARADLRPCGLPFVLKLRLAEQVDTRCNQGNGFLAATSWQVCNMQGGSSEGCFAAKICPQVMEFGPVNASLHKINEPAMVASLDPLKNIYKGVPERLAAV